MNKKQPFLTGFPTTICGRIRRRLQEVFAAKRRALADSSIATYVMQFGHILSADFLRRHSSSKRERHYDNVTLFWAWLAQILEANASCSKAVSLVQAWSVEVGLKVPSGDTGAYCKARNRIKLSFLRLVRERVNAWLNSRIRDENKYKGLVVKSLDGSSVQTRRHAGESAALSPAKFAEAGLRFPGHGHQGHSYTNRMVFVVKY